jgi:LytS/YehU family sensor histidine kinase
MQTRLGRRLAWSVEVAPGLDEVAIPPGMLITLVENAIKHGIEPAPRGGRIDVVLAREGSRLSLCVADSGAGLSSVPSMSGIGLANIRERLALLYGDAAALELEQNEPCGFRARILLPTERPSRHGFTQLTTEGPLTT